MKIVTLALLLAAGCAGCATRYDVTLSNGDTITAKGKPHLNKEKNVWLFTDVSGKPAGIPAGNVTQIVPQSMDSGSPTKFVPATSRY